LASRAAALEIQDAELCFKRASGETRVEPGYALVDGAEVLVGAPARQVARLRPRDLHTRFWSDLSLEPLPRPGATARTTADLAFAQLVSLWNAAGADIEEVVLVVPAQLSREKLGLLLGIAQECSIPVCGMVGISLLAVPRPDPHRDLAYLDAGLHEAVLTRIDQQGGASVAGFDTATGAGLLAFEERWIQRVAGAFLTQTRFDPLHQGATEQILYDELPTWIETLRTEPRVHCRIHFANQSYACSVPKPELVAAGQPLCEQIVDLVRRAGETPLSLQVSHRLAGIPGLLDTLAQIPDAAVTAIERSAPLDAALRRIDEIRSPADGVVLTTRLAWRETPLERADPAPEPAPAAQRPTHVVVQGLAHRIGAESFAIGTGAETDLRLPADLPGLLARHVVLIRREGSLYLESSGSASVQRRGGPAAPGTPLEAGDRIQLGEQGGEAAVELLLVALVAENGA